jgi:hypothetical protein
MIKTVSAIQNCFALVVLCLGVAGLQGCAAPNAANPSAPASSARIQGVNLNNLVAPGVHDEPVALAAAKNEWASFQVQVSGLPAATDKIAYTLRLQPLNLQSSRAAITPNNFSAYQILSMPVDVNRAGYVRHTGLTAATRLLPRALLPMPLNEGRLNLSAARDPARPVDPAGRANTSPVMLWVDLHIPPDSPPGEYGGVCDVLQTGLDKPVASVPIKLRVYDFVMPDDRHLNLVGQIEWESLTRLYPDRFEAVTPRFINRKDPRYAPAVKTLDQLVTLAQAHRVEVVVPRLQPTVKWPGGRPPQVAWEDFDSLVGPWLRGEMFADKTPLGFWPLPATDGLFEYDPQSQRQYWAEAATHFDQSDWLSKAPVVIEKSTRGRASAIETVKLSADAAGVLAAHSRVNVMVPLEDDQVQFSSVNTPGLVSTADAGRLITANPAIVFSPPIQTWPTGIQRPARWMRTDLQGLIPYVGAGGDERDVRLWAWLSFLPLPPPQMNVQYGPVQTIRWSTALPRNDNPLQPADPSELLWFYPGSWFGVDEPVPTIQLKWLRRAQQDYEYLYLAKQRGDPLNTLLIARLMSKPVELLPGPEPDQTFGMMPGTADPKSWNQALELIAQRILMHAPGKPVNPAEENQLNVATMNWMQPQEQPVIMGRMTNWGWGMSQGQPWINLQLGIDIYNASDSQPEENSLEWKSVPSGAGWQVDPHKIAIRQLATYQVLRAGIEARLDPARLRKADGRPLELTFTQGWTKTTTPLRMVIPVAPTDRREAMLQMNGSLEDWSADDAIQDGPMIRMYDRPSLQTNQIRTAANPAKIYSGWSDENFYLAFKLTGISQARTRSSNTVEYQFRRAWGEDLCQILIQPVYSDGSIGPILHVACKPNGSAWVERKMDARLFANPWQPFQGSGVRYFADTGSAPDWFGEVAIPWSAINDPQKRQPVMLRFNFVQHVQETGESASWAGPVDFGRDDAFTGILVVREPQTPGMLRSAQN